MSFFYTDYVNGVYDPTANTLGRVSFLTDDIALAILDLTAYTADPDAEASLADIPGAAVIATTTLSGLTIISRAVSSDPAVFAALTGPVCGAVACFMDTGTPSTSPLIAYLDEFDSGMPVTPDSTDFTLSPNAGGWFKLATTP